MDLRRRATIAAGAVLVSVVLAGPAWATEPAGPTTTTTPTTSVTTTTTTRPAPSTTTTTAPATPPPDDSSTTTTTAAPPPDDRSRPEAPAGQIDEVPPEEQELLDRYRGIERQAQDLLTQLEMVDGGLASAQRDLDDAAREVDAADRALARTEKQLDKVNGRLDDARTRLRERVVQAYIGGTRGAANDEVLQVTSVDELGKTLAYGAAMVEDQRSLVERMTALQREADELHDDAERQAKEADGARTEVRARESALQDEHDKIIGTQSDLARNAQDKLALLSEAARRQADIEAGYARQNAVHDSISHLLAEREAGQTPPLDLRGIFLSPIPNPRINQPFGAGYDPVLQVTRGHPGIDINAHMGDPIRAPADGEVAAAGWVDGYGNCTIIDHGSALGTLYGHQSMILVKPGDHVRRGQVIGLVGSTGYSTGPHLHWEVRILGNVVDPAPFIGDRS
jgi:murein DD-endopeptidase MepM/ murein hydrolase activator NlpD